MPRYEITSLATPGSSTPGLSRHPGQEGTWRFGSPWGSQASRAVFSDGAEGHRARGREKMGAQVSFAALSASSDGHSEPRRAEGMNSTVLSTHIFQGSHAMGWWGEPEAAGLQGQRAWVDSAAELDVLGSEVQVLTESYIGCMSLRDLLSFLGCVSCRMRKASLTVLLTGLETAGK